MSSSEHENLSFNNVKLFLPTGKYITENGVPKSLNAKFEKIIIIPHKKTLGIETRWIIQYLLSWRISKKGLSPVLKELNESIN